MTTIRKILAINHLNNDDLPKEITEIINGYVFYDIETLRIKQLKNRIHQIILQGEYFIDDGHNKVRQLQE